MTSDFDIFDNAITKYTGDESDVVIPDGITEICSNVFDFNLKLESITIPDSVTIIGDCAFSLCENLSSISIPKGVTEIGKGALQGCKKLKEIVIPDGVTEIKRYTFHDDIGLTTFTVPKNVERIETGAFLGCTNLTSLIIPESVREIENEAFKDCPNITIVCSEDSYTHHYCAEKHITYIFDYQFEAFHGVIPPGIEKLASPFLADEEKPFVFISYSHKDRDTILPIIKTLYESGWKIWYDEGLTIGDRYDETLEEHVENCEAFLLFVTDNSLVSAYVRENEIPWAARYNKPIIKCILSEGADYDIENGTVTAAVPQDGIESALEGISGLTRGEPRIAKGISVVFNPADRNEIADGDGFAYCIYTEKNAITAKAIILDAKNGGCVIREESEEAESELIQNCACLIVFMDKDFLADAQLTATLIKEFEAGKDMAICLLEDVEDEDLPEELLDLHKMQWLNFVHGITADMNTKLARHLQTRGCRDTAVLPGFEYEKTDEGIIIKHYIGMEPHVRIESSYGGLPVIKIDDDAFENCVRLKSVIIEDGIKDMGNYVFRECQNLESVTIPGSIDCISLGAFGRCTNLTSVSLGEGIRTIWRDAFRECTALTEILLPESIETLGDYVFEDCTNLTSIKLPSGLKKLGWYAFKNCGSLTSVTIPDGITEIGTQTFRGCTNLTTVTIPNSVTEIWPDAFDDCPNLTVEKEHSEPVKSRNADVPKTKGQAADDWEYFRGCSRKKRKRLLDHDFRFCLDDVGPGWEYVHFELDGKDVSSFRISYIGPGVREFVEAAVSLKEKENVSFIFYDEPGEHTVFMSRRKEHIYIELPYMDEGFFLKYDKFISAVSEVLK